MSYAFWTSIVFLTLSVGASTQDAQRVAEQDERDVTSRIAALSRSLDPDNGRGLSASEWEADRERNTSAIRREVTNYIESVVQPSEPQAALQARLRSVLAAHVPAFEHSDLATARIADLRFGRSLVVTYTVVRPPHFDSALVFGFREEGERFRLTATAGADFDGYTMFTLEVPSPSPDVIWLLAGGQAQTFNGVRMRFRLYGFDGDEFSTVWSPEDVFDPTVRMMPRGFVITHLIREPPYSVTEEYMLTLNGLIRVR